MENKEASVAEEKKVNVVDFKKMQGKPMDLQEYIEHPTLFVERGELVDILNQVLGNIDNELMDSFKMVVSTSNLVEVLVTALEEKGLISMEDISLAQKTLIEKIEKTSEGAESVGKR